MVLRRKHVTGNETNQVGLISHEDYKLNIYLQFEDTEGFATFIGNLFYFWARLKKEI